MIEIKNLYLNYIKEYSALYNINLVVNDKEKIAILGDKESGKTSLIRCICGLENFNKGAIYLNKINLKKINFKKDINLMYLSSNPVFFNRKSVFDNLKYSIKLRGHAQSVINQKVNHALEIFGIEELKDKKIKDLTKDEKQIVNIARSIVREADIYLVDDIFNFDDTTNKKIAQALIHNFKEDATIIFVIDSSKKELLNELNITKTYTLKNGSLQA